jgi:hypothetical protein
MMPPLGMLFGLTAARREVALTDLIGIVPVALGILSCHAPSVSSRALSIRRN